MMRAPTLRENVTLPDFRNLGVMLRMLVLGEFSSLVALVSHSPDGFAAVFRAVDSGLLFEMTLLCVGLLLFLASPWLQRFPYRSAVWLVTAMATGVAVVLDVIVRSLIGDTATGGALKAAGLAALLAGSILAYFNWRQRVLSPALVEARLIALQSRIRPHFLFNSLNTAVSLVRQDAGLAERVLLDMADLFRALLVDKRGLVPLADEVALAKSYLEIEQIRLGERLRVRWECADMPLDVRVPILVLQPLVENAIRYGVEPSAAGGDIFIRIGIQAKQLVLEVRNPSVASGEVALSGNRIALANIEERLALHFDAEASLRAFVRDGLFVVKLSMPLRGSDSPSREL